ncbi:MAG: PrsW family glutamic-type intramembrane protease [bacterium]
MLLLALAVAPGVFWLWYFLAKDRLRPEPRALVRRVFFLGGTSAFAAGLIEVGALGAAGLSVDAGMPEALVAAAVIGLIEEGVKFSVVLVSAYRHTAFDEVLDGIVYAVTASLGFATVENLFYVLSGGVGVGVARAVLSVPGHAFFGAVMGYYLGVAKFAARETLWLLSGLGLATLAHTIYDALVFSQSAYALAVIPFVLVLWRRSIILTRRAHAMEDPRTRAS